MNFAMGIAVFVSPWMSLFGAVATRVIPIEYKKKRTSKFPVYSALIISIIAYCTYNMQFGDFGILTYLLQRFRDRSLIEYAYPEIVTSLGPFNWIYYIISKSGDYALMCMIPAAIIYYVYGKITIESCMEHKIKYQYFIVYYFLGMLFLQFFTILEHGRFVMAGCILLYATYRELYVGKRDVKTVVLYFLPLCFHLGILPLYAFRIIVVLFTKAKILWFSGIVVAYLLIMYSGDFFSFLPYALMNYILKGRAFFGGESDWGNFVFHNKFYLLLRMLFDITFVLIILLATSLIKSVKVYHNGKQIKRKTLFLNYILEMAYFCLLTNFIVSEAFWRYGTLLFFLIPFLVTYAKSYLKRGTYRTFKSCFLVLGIGITMMHIVMVLHNDIMPFSSFFVTASRFNFVKLFIEDFIAFVEMV